AQLLGHQRISDVEHIDRDATRAVEVGKLEPRQCAQHPVGEPAHGDDAEVSDIAGDDLVEFAFADELSRGWKALLDLAALLRENDGRMRQSAIFETRRAGDTVLA